MRLITVIADQWLGLCRKPPAVHALQMNVDIRSRPSYEGQPDGGGSGSGTLRRGIESAISGMRILNRNRQLLWFGLLVGLVLAGNIIAQGALCYIDWILTDGMIPLVLDFFIEYATVFCLVFLLAGLLLNLTSEKRGSVSFFTGLAGAKKYLKAIGIWSCILAFAGILLYRIIFSPVGFFWSLESFLTSPLLQYPFTLNLNPSTFAEIPGYEGRSLLFWTYPYGFENALTISAINILLFILTIFVVPPVVLGQKSLGKAIAGSIVLLKKTWVDIAACAVFLGVIVSGVFLVYLPIQAAHAMFTHPDLLYAPPTGIWLAIGIFYYVILFSIVLVMATVGEIAALDLYTLARTGHLPESADPTTVAEELPAEIRGDSK